MSLITGSNRVF